METFDFDPEDSEDEDESNSDSQASSSSHQSPRVAPQKSLPKTLTSSRSKPPAWTDPADTNSTHISLLSGPTRLRKLRQAVDEDEISGRDYETRLRAQFERINPEPAWARKARHKGKGRAGASDDEAGDVNEEEDGKGIGDLLSSTSGILGEGKQRRKNVVLPQGTLAIERVRDANQSVQGSGSGDVRVLAFHPKPAVPVLCVATADRRIRLFNVSLPYFIAPLLLLTRLNLNYRSTDTFPHFFQHFTYHLSPYSRVQASYFTPRVIPCSFQVHAHFSTPTISNGEQAFSTAAVCGAQVSTTLLFFRGLTVIILNEGGEATMSPEVAGKAAAGTPTRYYIPPFRQAPDPYWPLPVGVEMFTSWIGKLVLDKLLVRSNVRLVVAVVAVGSKGCGGFLLAVTTIYWAVILEL